MNRKAVELNERAINIATQYKRAEVDLISILQEIDTFRAYLHFDCTSLYDYCVENLKLSESTSYNLITVARKASEVPQLKEAIANGELTVSKARKLVPVLTQANKTEWLEFAKSQTSREIEKAVAAANPQLIIQESVRYRAEDRIELKIGISEEVLKNLERVLDLESQRTSKPATKEQALAVALEAYLQKHDPVRKAERIARTKQLRIQKIDKATQAIHQSDLRKASESEVRSVPEIQVRGVGFSNKKTVTIRDRKPVTGQVSRKRKPLRALLIHQIMIRDQNQCTHTHETGGRCQNKRWLEHHHITPVAKGGKDIVENLTMLCAAHHRMSHRLY